MSVPLNQITAVVLAGGLGTRVRHLLPGVPKPMAPVAGRPFLEWVVRYLAKQGIERALLSTGHLGEVIEQHFQHHPVTGIRVQCVREPAPLGTGGGFLHAVRATGHAAPAWLVLNGDSLIFADLQAVAQPLDDTQCAGAIVGRFMPDASRYGTLGIGPKGELLRFEEKRPGSGVINSGIYLLRNTLIPRFPTHSPLSLERDVFPKLLANGAQFKVVTTTEPFLDIGTPESLPQAEGFIRQNLPKLD